MARPATGSIIERDGAQGTTYAARFRAYGERQYITLGHSWDGYTRRSAETELQNILADVRRGIWKPDVAEAHTPPADPTFHEFASSWYEDRRHEVAPRTAEAYQWALINHLLPFFAKHRLSQITIAEVDRYRSAKVRERDQLLVTRTLADRSINATLNMLAQVLEVAVEYGHLASNPPRGRRRRLKAKQPKRTWLEPEQVEPLRNAAVIGLRGGRTRPDPRTRTLYATAICTGLRIGELLALRWQDVDLASGRLTVRESKTDAGTGRDVDLWVELREELATFKGGARWAKPGDLVFPTATGRADTRSNVAKRLQRAVQRANALLAADGRAQIPQELSPHSLRRTFASFLYCRGETPVYVMQQMGHSDPKLALRIYTKTMGDLRRRGPGSRLVAVLAGPEWTQIESHTASVRRDPADPVGVYTE
jgi:integrase